MELPPEQRRLFDDLCAKLDRLADEAQLIRFMAEVLGSLLRRQGDALFRRTVEDAFTTGLAGRPWPQQLMLARDIIALVITKRPAVAVAWQRLNGGAEAPFHRRAADDDLPPISLDPAEIEPQPQPAETFDAFQAAFAAEVTATLHQRLALFALPTLRFPSPAYVHELPFFLANPAFAGVAGRFFTDVLLPLWEDQLRALHQGLGLADPAAALAAGRAQLWTVVAEHMQRLAALVASARAKLAVARGERAASPEYHMVEVPVSRKRTVNVLGVRISLGSVVAMEPRLVPVKTVHKPTAAEMLALHLATQLHDLAADAGLELAEEADLSVLDALFAGDFAHLGETLPDLLVLAGNPDAEPEAVVAAVDAALAGQPPAVAAAVAVKLFTHGVDGGFGIEELAVLAARWGGGATQPLLAAEIARRPRELAFQVREVLRRRLDRNSVGLAVVMLLEAWRVLTGEEYRAARAAALTVFSAFPITFAGDPDEAALCAIGAALIKGLDVDRPDAATLIDTVVHAYGKLPPRK